MSIRAVLVTGGAGFIASHIVDAYIAQGLEVTVLDNLSSGVRANVNMRAKFVHGVDVVNHHAAQIDVRKSVADPAFDAETNVVGSLRLLSQIGGGQAIPPVLTGRIACPPASSGGLSHPTDARSFRSSATSSITRRSTASRMRRCVTRTSTARASAKTARPAWWPSSPANCWAAKPQRSTATANRRAGAFNVGTGVETSVVELFRALREIAGSGPDAVHAPAKLGEQMRSVLDGTKLRRLAKLPEPVPLRAGLPATVDWMKQRRS